jgi:hypothetical protein
MKKLPLAKRVQILSMLVEGMSMRSISRVADVSIDTVTKLLVDAGETRLVLYDDLVGDVKASRVQCDEIWSFVGAKQKNVADAKGEPHGDVWTWTAMDAEYDTAIFLTVRPTGSVDHDQGAWPAPRQEALPHPLLGVS